MAETETKKRRAVSDLFRVSKCIKLDEESVGLRSTDSFCDVMGIQRVKHVDSCFDEKSVSLKGKETAVRSFQSWKDFETLDFSLKKALSVTMPAGFDKKRLDISFGKDFVDALEGRLDSFAAKLISLLLFYECVPETADSFRFCTECLCGVGKEFYVFSDHFAVWYRKKDKVVVYPANLAKLMLRTNSGENGDETAEDENLDPEMEKSLDKDLARLKAQSLKSPGVTLTVAVKKKNKKDANSRTIARCFAKDSDLESMAVDGEQNVQTIFEQLQANFVRLQSFSPIKMYSRNAFVGGTLRMGNFSVTEDSVEVTDALLDSCSASQLLQSLGDGISFSLTSVFATAYFSDFGKKDGSAVSPVVMLSGRAEKGAVALFSGIHPEL